MILKNIDLKLFFRTLHKLQFGLDYCMNFRTQPLHRRGRRENENVKVGLVRDLNPGPRAPEAQIIPLDQRATFILSNFVK